MPAKPSSDAVLFKLLPQFPRLAEFEDEALVAGVQDVELVAHLEQLVFGEHVQLAAFLHENAQLRTVREDLVPIFGLNSADFFLEGVHEDPAPQFFLAELHDVLVLVTVRFAQVGAVPSSGALHVECRVAFGLHAPLVEEFKLLVLFREGGLDTEVVDSGLVQHAHQLLGIGAALDEPLRAEVFPARAAFLDYGSLLHNYYGEANYGEAIWSQYLTECQE
jgi:hypothetical protein